MFGDPKTNPKGWDIRLFTEVAQIDAVMTTDYAKYANYPHVGIFFNAVDTNMRIICVFSIISCHNRIYLCNFSK